MLAPDRFMGNYRTTVNIIGYAVATFVVARWEGLLNKHQAENVLDGRLAYALGETNLADATKKQAF